MQLRFTVRNAICVFALAIAGCGGGGDETPPAINVVPQPLSKPGVLSISAMPKLNPYPATPAEVTAIFTEAFNLAYDAGARGQVTTYTWKELEPTLGNYDTQKFNDLAAAINNAQSHNMTQFVGIQLINTTNRELPAELAALAFDDSAVISQFRLLLSRLFTAHAGKIKYLSIGNEVDAYLRAHPAEWSTYKTLYNNALQYAHTLDTNVKVGVTGTADGALIDSPVQLADLNAMSDVVMLTYYPISYSMVGNTLTVTADSPTVVASDFPMMLNFAGSKPLVFQEVGYPASTTNGSSEAMQSQFVTNVFSTWKTSSGKIPFLNYFLLHDFTQQMCDDFGAYYGLPNIASFESFLCSLGLRTDNGTPRAAWNTFRAEATQAGFP
jgi:hypothetical protein